MKTSDMRLTLVLLCSFLLAGLSAHATTSGLNNIPTADVTPANVLVLQQINNFGSDQQSISSAGFKYGLASNFEIGLDKRIAASGSGSGVSGAGGLPAGPWVLQVKYRYALPGSGTNLGFGVANIGSDSSDAGDSFPYAVASHDLGAFRGHVGYGGTEAGRGMFVGVDKTLESGTVLRADWTQTNDRDDSVASLGLLHPLSESWIVEGWMSFPTESGVNNTFTLKFDYVIKR